MSELLREVAIARQEKQTLGLRIEPTDVEESPELRRQEIVDRVGRVRVAPGGDETRRLVQDDGEDLGPPTSRLPTLT